MKNLFFSYMHNNKEGNILVFYTGKCLGKQLVEVEKGSNLIFMTHFNEKDVYNLFYICRIVYVQSIYEGTINGLEFV